MRFPNRSLRKKQSDTVRFSAESNNASWNTCISGNLDLNINNVKAEIGSSDLIVNLSEINSVRQIRFACVYIDNLISNQVLSNYSVELGKILASGESPKIQNPSDFFNLLRNHFSSLRKVSQGSSLESVLDGLLSGELVFLIDGNSEFLSIDAYSPEGRAIEEPTSQSIVRGPCMAARIFKYGVSCLF